MDEAAVAIRAAGAVLWRDGGEDGGAGVQVALVHRPRYGDWSFPKGKVKPGEHVLRAAAREVTEETGVVPRLGRRLPASTYLKDGRVKRVDYWAARAEAAALPRFVPNDEVDRLDWLSVPAAEDRLSHSHDVDLLREFAAGPAATRPLVIVRHAPAGDKRRWAEPDELRPLDPHGRADAAALARLLPAYGPLRIVSSLTARCVDTVLPLARRTGAGLDGDPAFTVGATAAGRACERLLDLVADGVPTVVCTHGEIVADLVAGLCRHLGEKVPEDPSLRKGWFWAAHIAGDTIAALERHQPR
ncbi:NUDIX hydrolase [Actinomadura parmotrematis]|uniref:NUDIX hydrolase n=1 Tax=Actinomadura parmotrematis TaxID=2864039 RepID=A0ABS7FQN0_9ACTN|nr:NUDIX hydrolase [Actinomadura parmotrematis]MBW8482034.1 NUDIX hydrolase [Actinomadura parmotrematis]